ncbi:MAG: tetratricopeptide repeat protein [Acidobacteriota bacterium]
MPEIERSELITLLEELCQAHLELGRVERADELLRALEGLAPEAAATHWLGGQLEFFRGRYRRAEQAYRKALQKRPGDRTLRVFLGEALVAQRRWREALTVLSELISEGRSDVSHRFAVALKTGLEQGMFQRV